MIIDYNVVENEVIGLLEETQTIILATCTQAINWYYVDAVISCVKRSAAGDNA